MTVVGETAGPRDALVDGSVAARSDTRIATARKPERPEGAMVEGTAGR